MFGLLMAGCDLSAQEAGEPDTLVLMNGRRLPIAAYNDTSFTDVWIKYDKNYFKRESRHLRKRRKEKDYFNTDILSAKAEIYPVIMKSSHRSRDEIFAIRKADGREKMFYYYDLDEGNYLEVEAMRAFVAGQGDAYAVVSGMRWFWAGLGVGTVGAFASRNSILALAVPPIFALSTKIPVIPIPEAATSQSRYRYNSDYAAGYETQARSKNFRQALKGSVMGVVLGWAAYALVDANF